MQLQKVGIPTLVPLRYTMHLSSVALEYSWWPRGIWPWVSCPFWWQLLPFLFSWVILYEVCIWVNKLKQMWRSQLLHCRISSIGRFMSCSCYYQMSPYFMHFYFQVQDLIFTIIIPTKFATITFDTKAYSYLGWWLY